jgi:acetolactate synthase-1/2/3 large subunit
MAREQLNVTTIVFNNAAYSVLSVELDRVGAERGGEKARAQLDLNNPRLDFTRLAQGMGVHAVRVDSTEGLCEALEYAFSQPGPHLIDAIVPEALNANKRRALPYVLGALPRLPAPLARLLKRKLAP